MNIKQLTYIAVFALGFQTLNSCKSELEVEPKGSSLESNYYRNEQEAFNGLIAAYDPIGWEFGSTYGNKVGPLNAASDDCYAGGGSSTDMTTWQVWDNYTLGPANGPQLEYWRRNFSGVGRANVILEKLPNVSMDETLKARFTAEAKFLRAYYYFDLVRLFRNVPLFTKPVTTSEIYDVVQAKPEDVYAQIEKDLIEAIPNLPPTVSGSERGRATKGAAQALLGKVYLYQDNFGEAAKQFFEVNGTPGQTSQYGYKLLDNFGDLWKVNNKFNSESIFEVNHTSVSNGGWDCIGCTEGNVLTQMVGPRGYNGPVYSAGWGFNPITQSLFDALHYDPRFQYTVANIDSLEKAGLAEYEKGYMNTGYFIEKFAPKAANRSTGGGNVELNFPDNMYEIRLADTYLMEAEALVRGGGDAVRAAALLNAVRARVGLNPVAATMDNIMNERRLELATEGHRWFDLVRTGKAAEVLGPMGFIAGKHEVLPIPLEELSNTKLEQNNY